MRIRTRARRWTYLVHRWTGIFGCLLMALWFVSGVVMLYVGYPKLTPWERLGPLPALPAQHCCVPVDALPGAAALAADGLTLTSIGGTPAYVVHDTASGLRVLTAADGALRGKADLAQAMAEARIFAPDAPLRYLGSIEEDRWTHSRGLDAHRPLLQWQMDGPSPGTLYVSSATGQVVMDAPLSQQRWNYVGAWLHWLYLFRDRSVDPVWSWLVIALSAAGTFTAITGLTVGVWRWRFRGRYRSGSRTPYPEPWMRWHHITGLAFSAFVCTWIFSGLMSMNPFGLFSAGHPRPDVTAYQGKAAPLPPALAQPASVIQALQQSGFHPVELHWRRLGGQPYVLAHDRLAHTRVVRAGADGVLRVAMAWEAGDVLPAAQQLFAYPVTAQQVLMRHDAYYYQRHAEAMNGARMQGLPALRLDFADPGGTRVYIDLQTGQVNTSLDRAQRVSRWLFYFLHSWDIPALLRGGMARDLALILLSVGGLAVSVTGVVIGWRRLRSKLPRR